MGCTVSDPLPDLGDVGYVCVLIDAANKCRFVHAPKKVTDAVAKLVSDIGKTNAWSEDHHTGAFKFHFPPIPFFGRGSSTETDSLGNLFVLRLLEVMHTLGYEFILSSDLSSIHGQSSLFFRLAEENPIFSHRPILCVAPGSHNKLVLLNHNELIVQIIKEAIKTAWPLGIELETTITVKGEHVYEFRLNGSPWLGRNDQATKCRKLLLEVIRRLASIGFQFHANVNINDDVDTMFFIQSDQILVDDGDFKKIVKPPHLSMLSLNRLNRFHLINYDHDVAQCVNETVVKFYRTSSPLQVNHYGATEFQLSGSPLLRSGDSAIMTRQLICYLLESLLEKGWTVLTTLDISWKEKDKSIFILEKPLDLIKFEGEKVACISLDDAGKMRLIHFPYEDRYKIRDCVFQNYHPGVFSERHKSEDCHEIVLNGLPWSHSSSQMIHARSLMALLLKEAKSRGWNLLASADIPAKFEESHAFPVDVHSWFFRFGGKKEEIPENL